MSASFTCQKETLISSYTRAPGPCAPAPPYPAADPCTRRPALPHSPCRLFLPLTPTLTDEDRLVVENVAKLVNFLAGGNTLRMMGPAGVDPTALRELLPFLPAVATQMVPEVSRKLLSRITARLLREVFI